MKSVDRIRRKLESAVCATVRNPWRMFYDLVMAFPQARNFLSGAIILIMLAVGILAIGMELLLQP
ncbi:hypothetical protein [Hoeflea sp.]|uniref:hypothetical protein n=1 Tax=Hoeflea sp. TaxID=1940281 RepID=UPI003B028905